jgi:hypothetical protein
MSHFKDIEASPDEILSVYPFDDDIRGMIGKR